MTKVRVSHSFVLELPHALPLTLNDCHPPILVFESELDAQFKGLPRSVVLFCSLKRNISRDSKASGCNKDLGDQTDHPKTRNSWEWHRESCYVNTAHYLLCCPNPTLCSSSRPIRTMIFQFEHTGPVVIDLHITARTLDLWKCLLIHHIARISS